jgi:phage baseplate assembly protein W
MALTPSAAQISIGQDIEVVEQKDMTSNTYAIDFATGRVGGFIDGADAMKQAIYKILMTERFAYLIYSWNYGFEMNTLLGKSMEVIDSEIKRTIREALMADSRILDVADFTITKNRNTVQVEFVAETVFGNIHVEGVNVNV